MPGGKRWGSVTGDAPPAKINKWGKGSVGRHGTWIPNLTGWMEQWASLNGFGTAPGYMHFESDHTGVVMGQAKFPRVPVNIYKPVVVPLKGNLPQVAGLQRKRAQVLYFKRAETPVRNKTVTLNLAKGKKKVGV